MADECVIQRLADIVEAYQDEIAAAFVSLYERSYRGDAFLTLSDEERLTWAILELRHFVASLRTGTVPNHPFPYCPDTGTLTVLNYHRISNLFNYYQLNLDIEESILSVLWKHRSGDDNVLFELVIALKREISKYGRAGVNQLEEEVAEHIAYVSNNLVTDERERMLKRVYDNTIPHLNTMKRKTAYIRSKVLGDEKEEALASLSELKLFEADLVERLLAFSRQTESYYDFLEQRPDHILGDDVEASAEDVPAGMRVKQLFDSLSPKETQISILVEMGMTNQEISEALDISVNTAKGYVSSILKKLNLKNRTQLAYLVTQYKSL